MAYDSPKWVDTGDIDLKASQEGALGIVVPDNFADWMLNSGAYENLADGIQYDKNTGTLSGTLPGGFDMNDKLTWYLLLE